MNQVGDFFDKYFAWAGMLALSVLIVTNFGTVTNGLGTLTKDTGSFVGAFKGNG